jgi:hypothetical protein
MPRPVLTAPPPPPDDAPAPPQPTPPKRTMEQMGESVRRAAEEKVAALAKLNSVKTEILPPSSLTLPQLAEWVRHFVNAGWANHMSAGLFLITAKQKCPKGQWGQWLRDEFGWESESTARMYMQIARAFQSLTVSDEVVTIDLRGARLLAARRVPQEAREQAITQAREGQHITEAKAKELIEQAQKAEQEKQAALKQLEETEKKLNAREDAVRAEITEELRKEFGQGLQNAEKQVDNTEIAALREQEQDLQSKLADAEHEAEAKAPEGEAEGDTAQPPAPAAVDEPRSEDAGAVVSVEGEAEEGGSEADADNTTPPEPNIFDIAREQFTELKALFVIANRHARCDFLNWLYENNHLEDVSPDFAAPAVRLARNQPPVAPALDWRTSPSAELPLELRMELLLGRVFDTLGAADEFVRRLQLHKNAPIKMKSDLDFLNEKAGFIVEHLIHTQELLEKILAEVQAGKDSEEGGSDNHRDLR